MRLTRVCFSVRWLMVAVAVVAGASWWCLARPAQFRYWVDSEAISLDGKPAVAVINFGRAGDSARIQALLD